MGFTGGASGSGCSSSSCVLGGARRFSGRCGSRAPERRLRSAVRSAWIGREDGGSDWPVARALVLLCGLELDLSRWRLCAAWGCSS
jgi:hypothetical protein